ncbi:hypothetical protein P8C59_001086 [Phyllachora maydis]|uniref:t-SNARE coiled-coil homology domain-containing protein n=1 Tax=Phyllachora maydis TaxID=1825666 RepID=A0AAD9M9T4_9PEZI|nr:hypothetical protein P8C59_001086 [Phyllachora maydis]
MAVAQIQDRTTEFQHIVAAAKKRQSTKPGAQRLLSDAQQQAASAGLHDGADADDAGPGSRPRRSEFARKAAEIGRGIGATMAKLEKLATLAKRKTLFDAPVEINELTFIIKQDLSTLNGEIAKLQALSRRLNPKTEEGEHTKQVVLLLQGKLTDVSASFKDVLEIRTRNIQASKLRTDQFVSSVSQHVVQPSVMQQSTSPLYGTPHRGTPSPAADLISLLPVGDQQLLMMEEAQPQNAYIQQRGQAIEAIEATINELGSIFGQLAQMVSEQAEMVERIDANTEDVVDNVHGAQRELLKYWSRVSSNRWLLAKMFGVLMIFFLLWVLVAG